MTKRFKHMFNRLGMQFICYDDKEVLLGNFADVDGIKHIVDLLNQLNEENQRLKQWNNCLAEKRHKELNND